MFLSLLCILGFLDFLEPVRPLAHKHVPAECVLLRDIAEQAFIDQGFQLTSFQQALVRIVLGWVDSASLLITDLDFAVGCHWFSLAGDGLFKFDDRARMLHHQLA
jgi:hypothetical protein